MYLQNNITSQPIFPRDTKYNLFPKYRPDYKIRKIGFVCKRNFNSPDRHNRPGKLEMIQNPNNSEIILTTIARNKGG